MVKCLVEGTRNNVFVTIFNSNKVIVQKSIGFTGLKGSEKKTFFGAALLGREVGQILVKEKKINKVSIYLSGGWFNGEKRCLEGLKKGGLQIMSIEYLMKNAHNGIRKRKQKRR